MNRPPLFCLLFLLAHGCASEPTAADDSGNPSSETSVRFTVYTDAACTQLPSANSVVDLDTTVACNTTPDSSISELACFDDRITYTNHPNSSDCSASGITNELFVGVCQEFPGPVATWKRIEADTYECLSSNP